MKTLLPLLILILGGAITAALFIFQPEAEESPPARPVTQVEVVEVRPEDVTLTLDSQGTVLPRTETALSVEVAGRVVEMADNFRAGGYFREGDLLFRIDPADYEAAAAARAAELATAELALAQEKARAAQAAADWDAMGEGEPDPLTLRQPQLKQAKARVESAKAALAQAERDLDRTEVRAPYDGRVLSKSVDLGQYVAANPANPAARIYAIDTAEIRLPLTEREAGFIDQRTRELKPVRLYENTPAAPLLRTGHLARLEATVDPTSRLIYAVAAVDAPFEPQDGQPALRRGQFVQAEIQARTVQDVFVLPRYALRGTNTVYVLTGDNRLQTRTVDILKSNAESVILTGGLQPGEQVATSPIAYFVENMPVKTVPAD